VIATVREWSDEEGWGLLVADEVSGDIFAHFSNIQMDGYRSLTPGEHVEIEVVRQPVPVEGCWYAASVVHRNPDSTACRSVVGIGAASRRLLWQAGEATQSQQPSAMKVATLADR
jgi:cold shock protein